MNHASLFSGIGGFDLAAEWAGWNNVLQVEIDTFCLKVLAHHFPNAQRFTDVKQFDGKPWAGKIDVLSGGFPCQPYSMAGKRLGKEDERHLWPEMCRIIQEIRPRWVIGENVYGLTNWNGGVVFEEVQTDLENCGYEVWPCILPACGVGAPHRRDRIFFIAHANFDGAMRRTGEDASSSHSQGIQERNEVQFADQSSELRDAPDTDITGSTTFFNERREHKPQNGEEIFVRPGTVGEKWNAADTERDGLEHGTESGSITSGKGKTRERIAGHTTAESEDRDSPNTDHKRPQRGEDNGNLARGGAEREQFIAGCVRTNWQVFPTQSPICGGDDGLPRELDGITFSKWRNESIKGYGNAVVPQVVYQIFQTINRYEEH